MIRSRSVPQFVLAMIIQKSPKLRRGIRIVLDPLVRQIEKNIEVLD